MKNYLIHLFFPLLLINTGFSQSSIVAKIDLAKGQFNVLDKAESLQISKFNYQSPVKNLNAQLINNEIVLTYNLGKTVKEQYYQIHLIASINGRQLAPMPEDISGTYGSNIKVGNPSIIHKTTWENLISTYLDLKGDLILDLVVSLQRDFEGCDEERPTFFTWKDQKKHSLMGIIGAGSLIVGQAYKSQSEKNYETYTQISENFVNVDDANKTSERMRAVALYSDLESQRDRYKFFSWMGVGIIAADLLWEYINFTKFDQTIKDFERYCPKKNSVSIMPMVVPQKESALVGVQFSVQF